MVKMAEMRRPMMKGGSIGDCDVTSLMSTVMVMAKLMAKVMLMKSIWSGVRSEAAKPRISGPVISGRPC